jgi:beta-aspartyl-dipeptidase (metallo-type)
MLTLIENGEVYAPEPLGRASVLLSFERILHIGEVDRRRLDALNLPCDVVDASDCFVVPGFIDPHLHLIGGSGERGFSSQTPEISLEELALAGITAVVGTLGVDTATRTMAALIGKAKGLREEGISAFVWTGGYNVPPTPLTGSVQSDLLFVAEVIGAGEIAISDKRAAEPTTAELARLVSETRNGGLLTGKAGVTHFHVGDAPRRLAPLRTLLDDFDVDPSWIYPTHVERNEALMAEAVDLTHRGCTVDVDVVEKDLAVWLRFFREHGGDPAKLTVSSDAAITSPANLHRQLRACVFEHGFSLEEVLRLVTTNTAEVLKLSKGRLKPGADADVVVLTRPGLEIRDVVADGRRLVKDGSFAVVPRFLEQSDRRISLIGRQENPQS